ncbi:hypothetical protein HJC23_003738 [Cyclotella cryptica]|uniref:Mitochondrial carrier protein n=1 Tax=Cyclotella cryptica TaxID=29204 RepID=A0ABD3QUW7_9STRA|eukprot:CCRYP_002137-RA/>CCRYP_002137-RA protein AED:0.15 eAED:0.15 QI:0/-1/0/1/-1/1/1/0/270
MSLAKEFLAAGPGCALANGLLNCFETTKVKLQLHDTTKPVYRSPTTRGIMLQIAHEEGIVRGLLTPGLSASLTRSMLYGAYRVGLYSTLRTRLSERGEDPTWVHRLVSGMITGGVGSMLSCPLDVVRTRMQADSGVIRNGRYVTGLRRGEAVRYRGMISAFWTIFRQEGLKNGLYRGASVTVARASLLNGAQLASYDTLKRQLKWEEGPMLHSFCALLSGVVAQTVIMPIDTIKSQMMLGNRWVDVAAILQKNGPFYLYRGWVPACAVKV